MFDNNMNNNGNYNQGGRPLFGNNFDNSSLNNTISYEQLSNTSYQGSPHEFTSSFQSEGMHPSGFNNSNEVFAPGVSNDGSINSQNLTQQSVPFNPFLNQVNINMDIPPELGEIKSLNEATVATAPTMDALDPMNVMKENVSPKDPLDNYENGTLGSFNNTPVFPNSTFSFNNTPQMEDTPGVSVNNNGFENPLPAQDQPFNPILNQVNNNIGISNTTNYESMNNSQLDNDLIMKNGNINSLTNQFNNMVISTENNNLSTSFDTGYELNNDLVQDKMLTSETNELNSSLNSVTPETVSFEQPIQNNIDMVNPYPINNKEDLPYMGQDNEYTIVQNENLNKDDNTSTLSNLGIENTYDEPDTLDILDINDDESDAKLKAEKISSVSESVEKIKELIEKLKEEGANIDLEEFDFEDMYELIIKINKEAI